MTFVVHTYAHTHTHAHTHHSPAVILRVAWSECCDKDRYSTKFKRPANFRHVRSVHTVEPNRVMVRDAL